MDKKIISIVGLGESANEFKGDTYSIGVNDVQRTDEIVCVDRMNAFTVDRRQAIIFSPAKKFYSQCIEWNFKNGFTLLHLKNVHAIKTINGIETPCSNNSPFVACAVAFQQYRPREIRLYGADFNTHQVLSNEKSFETVVKDFRALKKMLFRNNCKLIIASEKSRLYGKI